MNLGEAGSQKGQVGMSGLSEVQANCGTVLLSEPLESRDCVLLATISEHPAWSFAHSRSSLAICWVMTVQKAHPEGFLLLKEEATEIGSICLDHGYFSCN